MTGWEDLPPEIRANTDDLCEDLARAGACSLEEARRRVADALRINHGDLNAALRAMAEDGERRLAAWSPPAYALGDGLLADALVSDFRREIDQVVGVCPHAVRFLGDSCPLCDGPAR